MRIRFRVGVISILVLAGASALNAQPAPRLFFTDLQSGPNTGGEENLGAFITIYGEGFGPVRGTSRVTIGGAEVARYVLWGEDNAPARSIDMIVVQPGPGVTSGSIVVTVQGQTSNSLPFTVRSGQIYFVDTAAPDASDQNPGSATQPFRTIYRPREVVQPGDIVYIKGGTYQETDPAAAGWDTVLFLSRDLAQSGTIDRPIAYIGYPGMTPVLGMNSAQRVLLLNQDSGPLSYYTIANLGLTAGRELLPLSGIGQRAIGNRLYDGGMTDAGALGVNGESSGIRILGNLLARNGQEEEKLHHGFYPGGYGTNRDIEFGWNEVSGQRGGRSIQLYGHITGDLLDDIRIHDNFIHGSELNNIVIGGSDGDNDVIGTVHVFNNIISGSREEPGLRINTNSGTVLIQDNTLYDNAVAQLYFERGGEGRITLQDNIVYPLNGQEYVAFEPEGAAATALISSHNLWFNAGPPPTWDEASVQADPLLLNPEGGNFSIGTGSAAVDSGVDTGHRYDFAGIPRPQGSSFDIGAHESVQEVPSVLSLYFPRLFSSDGTAPGSSGDESTGFAVVNMSGQNATITFSAFDPSGSLLSGPDITNPRMINFEAGQQLPLVDFQLFGSALQRSETTGWVRVDSPVQQIAGFFLLFDSKLTVQDGADVSSSTLTDFVFTEIERLGATEINIANPNPVAAELRFELITVDGLLRTDAITRVLSANGVLATEFADLFPGVERMRSDTIRVTSSQGVVPFEVMRRPGKFIRGLRGQDAAAGSVTLYCPQYVVGGNNWHTMVKIVNLDSTTAEVSYRWIGEDGIQIGRTQVAGIQGRGSHSILGLENFDITPETEMQGYLEIVSDGHRLAGSVIFGDQNEERYSATLPLVASLEHEMVFSQLASDSVYYTGLAMVNPSPADPAQVTIEIFGADGARLDATTETLQAGRRKSLLLTQYFPQLLGQERSSGYIRLTSDRPVAAFALFGTHSGSVLSAIPPQVVR